MVNVVAGADTPARAAKSPNMIYLIGILKRMLSCSVTWVGSGLPVLSIIFTVAENSCQTTNSLVNDRHILTLITVRTAHLGARVPFRACAPGGSHIPGLGLLPQAQLRIKSAVRHFVKNCYLGSTAATADSIVVFSYLSRGTSAPVLLPFPTSPSILIFSPLPKKLTNE